MASPVPPSVCVYPAGETTAVRFFMAISTTRLLTGVNAVDAGPKKFTTAVDTRRASSALPDIRPSLTRATATASAVREMTQLSAPRQWRVGALAFQRLLTILRVRCRRGPTAWQIIVATDALQGMTT